MITSACAAALAGLRSTKQSSSGSVDLHGAHFRGGNKYAGTYPAKNEHRGAHFRGWCTNSLANLCAGARLRGGNEYAVTPVTKGFSSPNDTPKPRKNCENGDFSTPLTGMESCTVDRGCTPAPKDATKLAVFFRFFRDFPLTFQ